MNCDVQHSLGLFLEQSGNFPERSLVAGNWHTVPYDTFRGRGIGNLNTSPGPNYLEFAIPITGVYLVIQGFLFPGEQRLLLNGNIYKRCFTDMVICRRFEKGDKLKFQIKPDEDELLENNLLREISATINLMYVDDFEQIQGQIQS